MANQKISVYVVDDEKMIAGNIAKNIERANDSFIVTGIFYNARDVLASLKQSQPDYLFTDISMPVMDGLELIAKVHQLYPDLKCIIISGYSDFEFTKRAIQNDVMDYLLKPINKEELSSLLERLLDEYRQRMHLSEMDMTSDYSAAEIVTAVKNHIHDHFHEAIDLGDIAATLGFSSSYLTKIFQAETQTTPSKYLREYRMNMARDMLQKTNLPVSLIGEKCGYPDSFHFSKVFHRSTGCSPTEFRSKGISGC
ncbi:MAG: response regulator [Lachnospiraceae bacterium]|nr:response regulator [Lachnospiraceae bacterium]